MVMPRETSKDGKGDPQPFDLTVRRVPLSHWGCRSAEANYDKKYKVGQGSYGFEMCSKV